MKTNSSIYIRLILCLTVAITKLSSFITTFSKVRPLQTQYAFSHNQMYLDKMVQKKKIVVDNMLRRHQDPSDPLVMRMTYMATECKYNVTRALKRPGFGKENLHTMSVLVDLKRFSPTIPDKRQVVEFSSAKQFAELLALTNTDAFLINLDEQEYGGRFSDLKDCVNKMKVLKPENPPPCIAKDIFIHPIQVQQRLTVYEVKVK